VATRAHQLLKLLLASVSHPHTLVATATVNTHNTSKTTGRRILPKGCISGGADFSWGKVNMTPASRQ